MDGDIVYSYAVNPRTLLMVDGIPRTRQNKIYDLTKDQVKQALKTAIVYRRFPETNIRVVPSNIDRLHNEVLYTEEEWEKIVDKELYSTGKVTDPVDTPPEEPDTQTTGLVNSDAVGKTTGADEGRNETPTVEEENSTVQNHTAENTVDEVETEQARDYNENDGETVETEEDTSGRDTSSRPAVNYSGKKKKRH